MPKNDSTFWYLLLLGCALLEALHAAGLVERALFAGVERVRFRGDLDDELRVLLAVLPLVSLGRADRAPDEEACAGSHILEYDLAVVLWVNICFHWAYPTTGLEFLEARDDVHDRGLGDRVTARLAREGVERLLGDSDRLYALLPESQASIFFPCLFFPFVILMHWTHTIKNGGQRND